MNKLELQKTANEIRKDIVTAVHSAKSGHPGGSLSAADVFTYLYFKEMEIDPKNPKDPDRDRFVLSKGHNAPGLYSALAERGYFPKEDLVTLRHLGSAGPSGYETHSGRRYVQRFSWTGNFRSCWYGAGRKNGRKRLSGIYPSGRR